MGGFNAPRIIGGGQIQQPREVNALDEVADRLSEVYEQKEAKRQYDQNFYQRAIDQDLKRKWLVQNHRTQAYEAWKLAPPKGPDGQKIPFDRYYEQRFPNIETKFSHDTFASQYEEYLKGVNNPLSLGTYNPADQKWYPGKLFMQGMQKMFKKKNETTTESITDPAAVSSVQPGEIVPSQTYDEWFDTSYPMQGPENEPTYQDNIDTPFPRFMGQKGSYIPGNRTGDKNPAMLEDGEYVLNRNAVKGLGKGWLDHVNNEQYPRFQRGGFMQPEIQGTGGEIVKPIKAEQTFFDAVNQMLTGFENMGDTGDTSMNLSSAEYDPMYTPDVENSGQFTWFAQKGGQVPRYQNGGYNRRVPDPYSYLDMIYPGDELEYKTDQREGYEDAVVRNMARDLREKRDVVASHAALDKEWDSRYTWNPKTWIPGFAEGVIHPIMDKVGSATGWWPSYTDIKAQQYREADRWEETPFPKSIDMTPEDMIWREETYYPNNPIGDMGTSNISNKILKERLKQLRGLK